jgi:hypothetical protein
VRFDWLSFVRTHHIEFVDQGPNTAKGNISIRCPWCASADPSHHMGLKLDVRDPQWGCLRNPRHRGTNPAFLIAKLLGIRYESALELVKAPYHIDSYEEALENLKMPTNTPETPRRLGVAKNRPLTLPSEFRPLLPSAYRAERFFAYLSITRGFGEDAPHIAREWGLHYALSGEQGYRLIFPVHAPDGALAGWTGRSIAEGTIPRYLTMAGMGKDVIYAHPHLGTLNRPALVIVEGPMDALKLNAFGGEYVRAIATMGTSFTDGQLATIVALKNSFSKMIVLSDRGAVAESLLLAEQLSTYARQDVPAVQLPDSYKDPGEMPKGAIKSFCSALSK